MDSIPISLALTANIILFWLLASVVYSVFLHPLSKYPGPLLAKITGWYEFFQVKDGYHHLWLYEMHLQYGPVVRVGPNRLSFNSIEAVRSIYGDRKGNIKKAGFAEMIALLKGDHRNLQTMNDRHAYAVRRRLIAHAFSDEALHSSQEYILNCIRNWFEGIRSKAKDNNSWTSDLDMTMWASLLKQDILGELCFGESFGACSQGSSDIDEILINASTQAQKLSWMPLVDGAYVFLGKIFDYGTKHDWEALRPTTNYDKRIDAMIERRLKIEEGTRKDFFHYITQAKDAETGETISKRDINLEAGVLFGAGVDTAATCITACLFYLLKCPEALRILVSEIRTSFSDVEDIVDGPELRALTYLRACIDETLRLSPPVPGPLLRQVSGNGIVINDSVLSPGVQVSVPSYALHHNKSYFPDPFTFKPERWLAEKNGIPKEAFIAFSFGERLCVGRKLAYLDMTLALARLLFSFDIRLPPGTDGEGEKSGSNDRLIEEVGKVEFAMKDWFVTGKPESMVQLRVRDSYEDR